MSSKEAFHESKQAIVRYLETLPSDPNNAIETGEFCKQGAGLYLNAIGISYSLYYPQSAQEFRDKIAGLIDTAPSYDEGRNTKENYTLDGSRITFVRVPPNQPRPRPQIWRFHGLIAEAGYIDERLPRFDYALMLDVKPKIFKDHPGRKPNPEHGLYYNYARKYWEFLIESQSGAISPETRLFALIFLQDLAKKKAVYSTKNLLFGLQPGNPSAIVAPPPEINQASSYVEKKVAPIFHALGYLSLTRDNIARLRAVESIDNDQFQLLCDIAFISKGKLEMGDLTDLVVPMIKAIGEKRYSDAYTCRDFLLRHFMDSFPDWRVHQLPGLSIPGVKSFVEIATAENKNPLETVPNDYLGAVNERLDIIYAKEARIRMQEKEKQEFMRKRSISARLLLYSIFAAAVRQKTNGEYALEDIPTKISPTSPLNVLCRMGITNPEDVKPTGIIEIYKVVTNEFDEPIRLGTGEAGQAQQYGLYGLETTHTTSEIFSLFLYQHLIDRKTVFLAYEKLREEGLIQPEDSVAGCLEVALKPTINGLESKVGHMDRTDQLKDWTVRKLAMLEDFIKSFDDNNEPSTRI